MTIISGEPPILIHIEPQTEVVVHVEGDPTLELSQVPGVGPRGPEGPIGPVDVSGLNAHIDDTTPHPAYDDLPSLVLLFENGLI